MWYNILIEERSYTFVFLLFCRLSSRELAVCYFENYGARRRIEIKNNLYSPPYSAEIAAPASAWSNKEGEKKMTPIMIGVGTCPVTEQVCLSGDSFPSGCPERCRVLRSLSSSVKEEREKEETA